MKVTEILKSEHQVILKKIDHAVDFFNNDNWKNEKYWNSFLLFLTKYADEYHHAKEENIYFKWMVEKNPMLQSGPLNCMLGEHTSTREIVTNAALELKAVTNNESVSWENFKYLILEYAQTLRNHIEKEDNILYLMAEQLDEDFNDGDQQMIPLFDQVESNLKSSIECFL